MLTALKVSRYSSVSGAAGGGGGGAGAGGSRSRGAQQKRLPVPKFKFKRKGEDRHSSDREYVRSRLEKDDIFSRAVGGVWLLVFARHLSLLY